MTNGLIETFLQVCQDINFPVAMEKTHWAIKTIIFLGMLLDTENQVACIQIEKKQKATDFLIKLLKSKKTTVMRIQQITGLLNFLCKAIFPARSFTHHYYAKIAGLKQYHHVRVNSEMKAYTRMWLTFLNSSLAMNRPVEDFKKVSKAEKIQFFTDAQASKTKGSYGCYFAGCGLVKNWTTHL